MRLLCYVYREPRGLGFIEYYDERDAEEAVRSMDRMQLGGREVSVWWKGLSSSPFSAGYRVEAVPAVGTRCTRCVHSSRKALLSCWGPGRPASWVWHSTAALLQ